MDSHTKHDGDQQNLKNINVSINLIEKIKIDRDLSSQDQSFNVSRENSQESLENDKDLPFTKFRIWKNIFIVSFGFFLLYTSFTSVSNLQSTLNKDQGKGPVTLAIMYAAFITSFVVVSNPVISRFGCKWSMFTAMILYLLYMASNFYPTWGMMISGSLLLGLGAGPLWSGASLYMTMASRWLSQLTKKSEKDTLVFVFGIFYMICNANKISGNVLSSVVLDTQSVNKTQPTQTQIEKCLANENVDISNITTLDRPDEEKVYMLSGIWSGLGVLGAICILFVDNIPMESKKDGNVTRVMMSTLNHFWNSRVQKILMPLSVYSGMLQGFILADFVKSFVACALGIENIGYVMICNGCTVALFSAIFGHFGKHIGQLPIFTAGFLLAIGLQTALLIWRPTVHSAPALYSIAALLGLVECILKSQLAAFYGHVFRDNVDAAFGNYFSLEGLGNVISFSYSSYIRTQHKLYILQSFLFLSIISYYVTEYIQRHDNNDVIETKDSSEMKPINLKRSDSL